MTLSASLRDLSTLAYAQGITQWSYRVPTSHYTSDLAIPSYWADAADIIHPGDWLFAVHTCHGSTYNVIYCFTSSPNGIWAQSLVQSCPPLHE